MSTTLRTAIPSLHSLVLFEASARHLNFSSAASELAITQPAVSHGIRQLEAALGQELFVRGRRNLTLTSHGRKLFRSVSGGFAAISETIESIAGGDSRETVTLSTSTVLATEWLLPKLPSFYEAHPDLSLEIRCLDRDPELVAGRTDIQLRVGTGHWPGCAVVPLWPERITPVCGPAYLAAHGPIDTLACLARHRLIHYVDTYRSRVGWAEWFAAQDAVFPASAARKLQVNDSLLAMRAAELGEGIALGWGVITDAALEEGRLVSAYPATMVTGLRHFAVSMAAPGRRKLTMRVCDWLLEAAGQRGGDR